MKDLYVDKEKHDYYYKGEKKDCVSDVLSIIDVVQMKGIPPKNLLNAGERGSRIHEQTENYEYGLLDMDEEWLYDNQDIEPYVRAYIEWEKEFGGLPVASEEPLYCEKTGVAGTIDLVKERNGKLALIDKKTSSKLSFLRCAIQLNIYCINWNETHERKIDELYILQLNNNGKYKLIPIEVDEALALKWIGIYNEIKGDKKI